MDWIIVESILESIGICIFIVVGQSIFFYYIHNSNHFLSNWWIQPLNGGFLSNQIYCTRWSWWLYHCKMYNFIYLAIFTRSVDQFLSKNSKRTRYIFFGGGARPSQNMFSFCLLRGHFAVCQAYVFLKKSASFNS